MTKLYTIATKTSECYGHGSYGTETRIVRMGGYGTGEFPPLFTSRPNAEDYLATIPYNSDKVVVEMEMDITEQ